MSGSIRRLVVRHPVAAFLIMVYGVNIAVVLPSILTRRDLLPFGFAPYDLLGHYVGSALPAFLVVAAVHGRDGVRELARRTLRWRVGVRWYLFAIFFVPVASVLTATALLGTAPLEALGEKWPLLLTLVLPYLLLALFSNLAEEIGWTGFLFDRQQDRYGPLKACLLVWVPFALFHLPGFYEETGSTQDALLVFGLLAIPQLCSRVLVAWLYNNTIRSVFLVGLFHSAFNTTNGPFTREFIPATEEDQFLILNGVIIIAAILIAVITRGRLSYRPATDREEHLATEPSP
ncbi:MAG: CPBP family intramembrane glutamic endopeptidase [Acidimicrobiia bacterium]